MRATWVAVLLACALAVTACTSDDGGGDAEPPDEVAENATDDEPDEPPLPIGMRVAVVLPDSSSTDATVLSQMAADVRRLDVTRGAEITSVHPVRPGALPFVADLAWELARRETDLVCIIGWDARALALELATLYPHLNFCSAPLAFDTELPDNIWPLEVRSEELGHVAGVAAADAADGGTIGLVLGAVTKSRTSFREGLLASVGDLDVVSTTVNGELDAVAAVQQVLDGGAEVVVIDSVAGAAEAVELAAEHALVLSPDVLVRGEVADRTVLTWRIHWDVVLRAAMDRLLAGPPMTDSFGFAEGALSVEVAAAGSASLGLRVERTVTQLAERDRDPLEPREDAPTDEPETLPRPPATEDTEPDADDDTADDTDADTDADPGTDPDDGGEQDGSADGD